MIDQGPCEQNNVHNHACEDNTPNSKHLLFVLSVESGGTQSNYRGQSDSKHKLGILVLHRPLHQRARRGCKPVMRNETKHKVHCIHVKDTLCSFLVKVAQHCNACMSCHLYSVFFSLAKRYNIGYTLNLDTRILYILYKRSSQSMSLAVSKGSGSISGSFNISS